MTTTNTPAPDDDPGFARYLADVGPGQQHPDDLPDVEVGRPVVVVIALLTGLAGIVVALGWAAFSFAIGVGVADTGALVCLIVGTLLVITGGGFAYLGHRDRQR